MSNKMDFWNKVNKVPSGCWEWAGGKNNGYGVLCVSGKTIKAHRYAWILTNGEIPKGEGYHGTCVLHKCDNPSCINPDHLFLGSNADNVRDRVAKNRSNALKGEQCYWFGKTGPAHPVYGLKRKDIRRGPDNPQYGRVGTQCRLFGVTGENHPSSKVTDAQRFEIKVLNNTKLFKQKELASEYGLSRRQIYNIINDRKRGVQHG